MSLFGVEFDPRTEPWAPIELAEGEAVSGMVLRLPVRGAFCGNSAFIGRSAPFGDVVALDASAKHGRTVLERKLRDVRVGDVAEIRYVGMRTTRDGERRYRHYEVRVK